MCKKIPSEHPSLQDHKHQNESIPLLFFIWKKSHFGMVSLAGGQSGFNNFLLNFFGHANGMVIPPLKNFFSLIAVEHSKKI